MTEDNRNFSNGTWEGSRREELRRWRQLPLVDKLNTVGDLMIESRKQ